MLGVRLPSLRVASDRVEVRVAATEGATARVCLIAGSHTLSSVRRVLASRVAPTGTCALGTVAPDRRTTLSVPLEPGPQTLAVRLTAETNAARETTVVKPVP